MKKTEEMELDNIMEEIKVEKFIDDFIESAEEMTMNHDNKGKMGLAKYNKVQNVQKKINKNTKIYIAKNIALMVVTGVCGYFKLATPILCIVIETICACTLSFKCGEIKGRMINNGRIA